MIAQPDITENPASTLLCDAGFLVMGETYPYGYVKQLLPIPFQYFAFKIECVFFGRFHRMELPGLG